MGNNLIVLNDPEEAATFSIGMGDSWVDVTLGKGLKIWEWKVVEEEMMSDQRAIELKVSIGRKEERKQFRKGTWKRVYNEKEIKRLIRTVDKNIKWDEGLKEIIEILNRT